MSVFEPCLNFRVVPREGGKYFNITDFSWVSSEKRFAVASIFSEGITGPAILPLLSRKKTLKFPSSQSKNVTGSIYSRRACCALNRVDKA